MVQTNCRHFNGYKPCGRSEDCSAQCPHRDLIECSILVIHLGALGAVVRSTSLLNLIRQKYPQAHLTWVTDRPADQLLRTHPLIDRVLTTSADDLLQIAALQFDAALVIDKSLKAAGVLRQTQARRVFGFRVDSRTGAVMPATSAAVELWSLGLSNQKKFYENQKSEVQLMCEALELPAVAQIPEYDLPLSSSENQIKLKRQSEWQIRSEQPIIGLNTGCSSVIPAKKLSVKFQREIIENLLKMGFENLVLLGGPEDTKRNFEIGAGLPIFQSPTEMGLRDGLVSVAACDLVITGDSLGMHMAISQKKYVIAWFGPTCAQEIELYGRGVKIQTKAPCAPCWKRSCDKEQMCYDQVSLNEILEAVRRGLEEKQEKKQEEKQKAWQAQNGFYSSKPLF